MNGVSTFINLCSFDFNTIRALLEKSGMGVFKKLKQQSHGFITPSNSNIFLIPKTWSTFPCISDTKVYILNLCLCMYYYYWYNEQYNNKFSISYLNSLCFRCKFW